MHSHARICLIDRAAKIARICCKADLLTSSEVQHQKIGSYKSRAGSKMNKLMKRK